MKTLSFLLALSLTISSFAATESVRSVVNEHRYFLTVEWNQKDMHVLREREEAFIRQISQFSEAELGTYLRESLSEEELRTAKLRLSTAMKNGETPMTVLRELSGEQQGASWNAVGTGLIIVGGIALSLFVLYTWFIHNQLECDGFYDCHGGE